MKTIKHDNIIIEIHELMFSRNIVLKRKDKEGNDTIASIFIDKK